MLSSSALAETQTNSNSQSLDAAEIISAVGQPALDMSQTNQTTEIVLPQLSFEVQQARVAELAKQSEIELKLEEEKRVAAEKIIQAQQRLKQEIGNNQLLLPATTAKIYADNNFDYLWKDKTAERIFLKEYAAFSVSGVSVKSASALQQILNMQDSFARDILLTDSFLDYLYYNKNVAKNANQWLYNLGSYNPKEPSENYINEWINSVKNKLVDQFMANLVPANHIYQETVQKLFEMPSNSVISSPKKNKKAISTSFNKLALNAQRLRFIQSFNNGIFVNIPSYQLYYIRDGQILLNSRVIVGRDERRTPVIFSRLSNVVINPPWNVPPTIKNKDLVPKMHKDPSYVERYGYEIIDGKGNKISSNSINWAAYDGSTKNFPYNIRQKAGDNSALGRFKFNMPSSDAIYLHDTPNRGLFSRTERALSSGCVRVAKADELATLLLKEAGWSTQRKQNVLASKQTTSAQIHSDTPVYLYYVTAWAEDGKIHSLPDIYRHDKNIPKIQIDWAKVKILFN